MSMVCYIVLNCCPRGGRLAPCRNPLCFNIRLGLIHNCQPNALFRAVGKNPETDKKRSLSTSKTCLCVPSGCPFFVEKSPLLTYFNQNRPPKCLKPRFFSSRLPHGSRSSVLQKVLFCNLKGHLLRSKRLPFAMPKAVFGLAVGHQPEGQEAKTPCLNVNF